MASQQQAEDEAEAETETAATVDATQCGSNKLAKDEAHTGRHLEMLTRRRLA